MDGLEKTTEVPGDNKSNLNINRIVTVIGFVFMILGATASTYYYFTTKELQPEKEVGMLIVYGRIGFPSIFAAFALGITGLIRLTFSRPNTYPNFLYALIFISAPMFLKTILTLFF